MRAKTEKNDPLPPFMTIPEVQAFLGIKSRKTILKYITAGKLQAYKIGGTRWRIAGPDVLAFLKAELDAIAQQPEKPKVEIQP